MHLYTMQMYTHASVTSKVRAAVAGASGYAGMTAVQLLAHHFEGLRPRPADAPQAE